MLKVFSLALQFFPDMEQNESQGQGPRWEIWSGKATAKLRKTADPTMSSWLTTGQKDIYSHKTKFWESCVPSDLQLPPVLTIKTLWPQNLFCCTYTVNKYDAYITHTLPMILCKLLTLQNCIGPFLLLIKRQKCCNIINIKCPHGPFFFIDVMLFWVKQNICREYKT